MPFEIKALSKYYLAPKHFSNKERIYAAQSTYCGKVALQVLLKVCLNNCYSLFDSLPSGEWQIKNSLHDVDS